MLVNVKKVIKVNLNKIIYKVENINLNNNLYQTEQLI